MFNALMIIIVIIIGIIGTIINKNKMQAGNNKVGKLAFVFSIMASVLGIIALLVLLL